MNKDELVAEIAKNTDLAKSAVARVVDSLTDTVKTAVSKGSKVALVGFGTFERRVRAARTARNPRTGEPIKVARTNVPAFKPGQGFKNAVSGKGPAAKKTAGKKTTAKKATRRR